MADHQLEPFENVELGEKQDQLQVFEKAVLERHYSIFVSIQTFVKLLLVEYIAFFYIQIGIKHIGSINRVATPTHISEIIFFTFVYCQIYVDMCGVYVYYAVFQYFCVSVTNLVIFFYQRVFIR